MARKPKAIIECSDTGPYALNLVPSGSWHKFDGATHIKGFIHAYRRAVNSVTAANGSPRGNVRVLLDGKPATLHAVIMALEWDDRSE